MSYHNHRGRQSLAGLGGVESCGPDQVWDPNVEFYGVKGQCMPRKNYTAAQLENPNAIPGVVKTTGASSSSSSFITDFFKALTATPAAAPAATAPVYVAPAATSVMGMSPTTLAIAGGGALLLILLATRD